MYIDDGRIFWKSCPKVAMMDKNIFMSWEEGKISTETAIQMLEKNNNVKISKNQFILSAGWLGYVKKNINFCK